MKYLVLKFVISGKSGISLIKIKQLLTHKMFTVIVLMLVGANLVVSHFCPVSSLALFC